MSRPMFLAPSYEQGLLWRSVTSEQCSTEQCSTEECCSVEHSTVSFICTPIQQNLSTSHLLIVQEQLVCYDPRASYEVTKSIS